MRFDTICFLQISHSFDTNHIFLRRETLRYIRESIGAEGIARLKKKRHFAAESPRSSFLSDEHVLLEKKKKKRKTEAREKGMREKYGEMNPRRTRPLQFAAGTWRRLTCRRRFGHFRRIHRLEGEGEKSGIPLAREAYGTSLYLHDLQPRINHAAHREGGRFTRGRDPGRARGTRERKGDDKSGRARRIEKVAPVGPGNGIPALDSARNSRRYRVTKRVGRQTDRPTDRNRSAESYAQLQRPIEEEAGGEFIEPTRVVGAGRRK